MGTGSNTSEVGTVVELTAGDGSTTIETRVGDESEDWAGGESEVETGAASDDEVGAALEDGAGGASEDGAGDDSIAPEEEVEAELDSTELE